MTPARRLSATIRTGFTLIELIVVIAIIGILSAIALMVGNRVIESGRIDMTKTLVRLLDNTQISYFHDRDEKAPYKFTDTSLMHNEFGIIDGRIGPTADRGIESERAEPSATTRHMTEYISVDGEMGFANIEDIKQFLSGMINSVVDHVDTYN